MTEDGLPEYVSYEFRTEQRVLYSVFFVQNSYINEYLDFKSLSIGYEYGLVEVEEKDKYIKRDTDYKIKHTVVAVMSELLQNKGTDFLLTINYSNAGGKSYKRFLAFSRWYEEFKDIFPLKKYDAEIILEEKMIYKSIIVHSEHPNLEQIMIDFSTAF